VLVVDDSSMIRDMVATMIERLGHEALCAPSGQMALEAPHCDVVFLDMEVGDMTGPEIAKALRERGYHGPIFGLSGHRRSLGLDGHLQKPFGLRDVGTLLGIAKARAMIGDAGITSRMLRDLVEELPVLAAQAKAAADAAALRAVLHTVRGNLRYLDEAHTLGLLDRLEDAAAEGRIDPAALAELDAALQELVARLVKLGG